MKNKNYKILSVLILLVPVILATYCSAGNEAIKNVTAQQAHDLIAERSNDPGFKIIDIRTLKEFKSGHLKGAELIDFYAKDFKEKIKRLDRNKSYLFYCRTGNRSGKAMRMIADLGFQEIYHMNQGIRGWLLKKYPVVRN